MSDHFRVVLCGLKDITSGTIKDTQIQMHIWNEDSEYYSDCQGILFFQHFLAVSSSAQAAEIPFKLHF